MIELDIALFRAQFKAYSDETLYPDVLISSTWDLATCYVSDSSCGPLSEPCRRNAINMMVAHLFFLNDLIASGSAGSVVTGATIGSVSVSIKPPETKDGFDYWLNESPYGQQLLALLSAVSVGGFYLGGSNERGSFRKSQGRF